MKNLILILVICTLASCQTLAGALGGGLGGGVGAAVGGPPAAVVGAIGGVIAMESLVEGTDKSSIAPGQPQGPIASTTREVGSLLHAVGWWYLVLFVLLPLLTKKGRTWVKKFTSIHNSVSKQDIDNLVESTVSKKDVDDHAERLHKLEEFLSSLKTKDKS